MEKTILEGPIWGGGLEGAFIGGFTVSVKMQLDVDVSPPAFIITSDYNK